MKLHARTRTMLAWSLWLATFGCCPAGLMVTLVVTRPLTTAVLAEGALYALAFPLAYGSIGLVSVRPAGGWWRSPPWPPPPSGPVDLDALSAELLAVVDRTVQPTKGSLWLRPPSASPLSR